MGALLGVFLLGVLTRKPREGAAIAGVAAGLSMPQLIRVDQQASVTGQGLADKRFSTGDAARQPNLQHTPGRRSAEATVLTISIAMVSGPTPPGTGVYAPARSTTSIGSTSPTSTLPF